MDLTVLPPEILEIILLKLDTQSLASCALVDECLEKIIYSHRFLDEYCRVTFNCSWLTAQDVNEWNISLPYEFWYWTYETVKTLDVHHGPIFLQGSYLTKIGVLKHLFFMWLTGGKRSGFMDSHTLMNVLYPLPNNIYSLFKRENKLPEPLVIDSLMKVFLWIPEIMNISCSGLKIFTYQNSPIMSTQMKFLYRTRLKSKLPKLFKPIFSVEILGTSNAHTPSRNPALMVLMDREILVLWFGMPNLLTERPDSLDYMHFGKFQHKITKEELQAKVQVPIQHFYNYILQSYDGSAEATSSELSLNGLQSPLLRFENSDVAYLTILLAQESFKALQKRFKTILSKTCSDLAKIIHKQCEGKVEHLIEFLNIKQSANGNIDDYIIKMLGVDKSTIKVDTLSNTEFIIIKCFLERIAYLFRNEIHKTLSDSFSHAFLCDCLGQCFPRKVPLKEATNSSIDKCLSAKKRNGLYSPQMWPPQVLTAAYQAIPAMAHVVQMDLSLATSGRRKCALSASIIKQLGRSLNKAGLCLTIRPPDKPRCAPVLPQIRLLTFENLGRDSDLRAMARKNNLYSEPPAFLKRKTSPSPENTEAKFPRNTDKPFP